jgi:hypothetical protein
MNTRQGDHYPILFTIWLQPSTLKVQGADLYRSTVVLAAALMALGIFQIQADAVRRVEVTQAAAMAQASAVERAKALRTEDERRRFEEKFNRLVSAMDAFQREYNASGGKVWPRKEADALKKAIQALHLP